MNYQVSRIRLASVGPEPARYDPLDLDLRNAAGTGPADTVLWLPNTGGKTVLLRLLFSVLHPQQAEFIGSEDARRRSHGMAGYVLDHDVAHVVIEWRRTDGGEWADDEVLITGHVAEWKSGGRATTNPADLNRLWYSVKGSASEVGIDRLVFDAADADGARRKVPVRRYRDWLDGLRRDRRVDVKFEDSQRGWLAHLDNLGLDPALFRFQAQMNRDEAGASNLARFRDDLDFIEFFLDAVIDPAQLGVLDNEFAEVADKVRRFPETERRLRFAEAAMAHLEPLAAEVQAFNDAAADLDGARRDALLLLGRFEAARDVVAALLETERERERQRGEDYRRLDRESQGKFDEAREFRRMLAEFHHAEVKAEHDATDERVRAATLDERAWLSVDDVFLLRYSEGQVAELDRAAKAELERLQPLQDERDAAASVLLTRLAAEAVIAEADAARERATAKQKADAARDKGRDQTQALVEAERLDGDRRGHERALEAVRARRDRLVAAGMLASDEATADALALERAASEAARARQQALAEETGRLEAERSSLDREDEAARPETSRLSGDHDRAAADAARAIREREALVTVPLLAEAAEDDAFDIEVVGPALADRLSSRASEADAERIVLEVRGAEDRRALASLEEDGLLPPPVDVARALDRLHAAGITGAMPGTQFLATAVGTAKRQAVLAHRADLVAGIVVTDPADMDRARSILSSAALDPSIIVAVGPSSDLVAAERTGGVPAVFVVPPAPAVWDREAAPRERDRRQERVGMLDSERSGLEHRASEARDLAAAIRRHLTAYPAGWVSAKQAEVSALAQRLDALREAAEQRAARRGEIRTRAAEIAIEARAAQDARAQADRRAGELARLGEDEAGTATLAAEVDRLKREAAEWRDSAAASAREAERLADEADQARRAAQGHAAAAERIRGSMTLVELASRPAEPSAADAPGVLAGLDDLPRLRARFETLDGRLRGELGSSDIAARRRAAIEVRDRVLDRLRRLPTEQLERAEALAATPEAGDPAGRAEAVARSAAEAADARHAERLAFAAEEAAKKELADATESAHARRAVRIEPERLPRDKFAAAQAEADATREAQALSLQQTDAGRDRDDAKAKADEAAMLLEALKSVGSQVRIALRIGEEPAPEVDPFDGGADAVRSDGSASAQRLTTAQDAHERADRTWRGRVDRLRVALAAEEFRELASTDRLHRRLSSATPEQLAQSVAEDVQDVRATIGVLSADLDRLQEDIKLAVTALAREANSALSHLRGAERDSRMPATLHGWGGEPFLTIRYERPSPGDVEARLTSLVHGIVRRSATERPTGTKLLRQALQAAVPGGFAVKVLKPNEGFEPIWIPVTDLASVTVSGGQRSTAATALLLMLSERRRKSRSAGRQASVGALFLDNPFGTANAGFLIDVQRTVAEAAGIQLVYSTGIGDFAALRRFPNPIALSNDAARRTMRKYVHANPELLALLTPAEDGPGGRLSAARVVRAPAPERQGAADGRRA